MLSKSQISLIKSLHQKKFRKAEQRFVVEGEKLLEEFILSDFKLDQIYCVQERVSYIEELLSKVSKKIELHVIQPNLMQRITAMVTAPSCLAIVHLPSDEQAWDYENIISEEKAIFMLDDIKDPGNLGTIVRIADWFGFRHVVCSEECVDLFNPKTVQSSMGSITRVKIQYGSLEHILTNRGNIEAYAADLQGLNVMEKGPTLQGFIVMGSESHGVSEKLRALCNDCITIPRFGQAESLNVAVATAIIATELRRG